MGTSRANEVLLLGKKLTAHEAKQCGLVADVFAPGEFQTRVGAIVAQMAEYHTSVLVKEKR